MNHFLAALILVGSLVFSPQVLSQTTDSTLAAIDRQVWEPFVSSYNDRNAEAFNAVHHSDVLRITESGIRVGDDYFQAMMDNFSLPGQPDRSIELRFEHRIHTDSVACETGIYRVQVRPDDGPAQDYYGHFHVVLRRFHGVWKIVQDFDSAMVNGERVGEEAWKKLE